MRSWSPVEKGQKAWWRPKSSVKSPLKSTRFLKSSLFSQIPQHFVPRLHSQSPSDCRKLFLAPKFVSLWILTYWRNHNKVRQYVKSISLTCLKTQIGAPPLPPSVACFAIDQPPRVTSSSSFFPICYMNKKPCLLPHFLFFNILVDTYGCESRTRLGGFDGFWPLPSEVTQRSGCTNTSLYPRKVVQK